MDTPTGHPSSGFAIRSATNADEPAVRRVLNAVRAEYGVEHHEEAKDADLADIERNYLAVGGCFEVVTDSAGRIVGCAGLRRVSARRVELCKMYIEKPARGRGLGRRMLEDMLAAARQGGFTEIWLETNSILSEAIALYTRYGFRPVASEQLGSKCDAAYLLEL